MDFPATHHPHVIHGTVSLQQSQLDCGRCALTDRLQAAVQYSNYSNTSTSPKTRIFSRKSLQTLHIAPNKYVNTWSTSAAVVQRAAAQHPLRSYPRL